MTTKRAPTVATWLMKHFGCGPNTDAVLGDLAEQCLHKSRMWYWRQVLKGIPVSMVNEALGHKAITAKAIVAGCIRHRLRREPGTSEPRVVLTVRNAAALRGLSG